MPQAQHRVLTEDVRFLEPRDQKRVLDGEREVVAAFAARDRRGAPRARRARACDKPLTMLLFGMMNWMFTWLQPDGALSACRHGARSSPTCSSAACGAVRAPAAPRMPAHAAGRSRTASSAPRALVA